MMMRNKQERGDIRTALPRMTEYLRASMGIIVFALVLAALSAVMRPLSAPTKSAIWPRLCPTA